MIDGVTFDRCTFERCTFERCTFERCTAQRASLRRYGLEECGFVDCDPAANRLLQTRLSLDAPIVIGEALGIVVPGMRGDR